MRVQTSPCASNIRPRVPLHGRRGASCSHAVDVCVSQGLPPRHKADRREVKRGEGGGNGAFAFGSGRCAEVACAGAGAQRMQGDEAARDAIGNRRIATLAPQTRPMAPRGVPAQRDAAWGTTAAGQAVVELGRFGPTVAESNIWRRSTKVGRFWPNPGRPKRTPS